jgi:DNA-binding NarL/FixJ family response regulator
MQVIEKLFVVDDHSVFGQALSRYLATQLPHHNIVFFSDPKAAYKAISQSEAALIIMDIQMPGLNGIELQQQLATLKNRHYRFVFCTAEQPERIRIAPKVLRRASFFFKDEPLEAFLNCVEQTLQGSISHSEQTQRIKHVDTPKLTRRQHAILQLLQQGLTNEQISTQLAITLNTTKTHLRELFARLEVKNRTACLHKAQQLGLID